MVHLADIKLGDLATNIDGLAFNLVDWERYAKDTLTMASLEIVLATTLVCEKLSKVLD